MEILKDLYINYVGSGNISRKDYLLNDRVDKITKDLLRELNKQNKKKIEKLCNDYQEINLIETQQSFARGFAFAVQLLTEAFSEKL